MAMKRPEALAAVEDLEDKEAVKSFEPIEKAVRAMTQNRADKEIQKKGVFGLALICLTRRRFVMKANALKVVMAAMQTFVQDERLQADGCEFIRGLCVDDGTVKVMKAGGLQAVVISMTINPESQWVQQEGLGALAQFAKREPEAVIQKGGLDTVIRTMENFPRFSWVQMWGCQALICFVKATGPTRIQDLRGFEIAEAAMQAHEKAEAVQRFGAELLQYKPVQEED